MNSDNYKKAFSNIRPSDERLERIFDMTEKKKRARGVKKGLIAVMAVIVALMCGALTANAATDGALFDGVRLIINGEEVSISDYLPVIRSYINDDGEVVDEYTFALPEGEDSISLEEVADSVPEGNATISVETESEGETESTTSNVNYEVN